MYSRFETVRSSLARARDADVDDLTVILARVSSNDIASFIAKIKTISGVTKVNVESRHSGEPERSPDSLLITFDGDGVPR
jgi:hypothetical protein